MTQQTHILVVDDHADIREPLAEYLERHGFTVSAADGALAARDVLVAHAIDLVILDVMMPGEDGLSLFRSLDAATRPPVIFLTAMAEETDRVVGLELGADDYVTKPFSPRELVARIKAVLRRSASASAASALESRAGEVLAFGPWRLDLDRRELSGDDGVAVPLSTADFTLLSVFLRHPRRVLSRDQLMDMTSGREADVFDRSIDNQVSRLRKKIETDPRAPDWIKTVRGGGYVLAADVRKS